MFILLAIYATVVQANDKAAPAEPGISPLMFFFILLIICIVIGIFAVLAGVGGGVIFTPLMMG